MEMRLGGVGWSGCGWGGMMRVQFGSSRRWELRCTAGGANSPKALMTGMIRGEVVGRMGAMIRGPAPSDPPRPGPCSARVGDV